MNQDLLPPSAPNTVQAESGLRRPTDEEIVGLFERMHKSRPEFVFLANDMRKTLETQLRWNIERDRVMKLWESVTQHAAHTPLGSPSETATDKSDSEQNDKLQSNITTFMISSSDGGKAKTYLSAHTKQAAAQMNATEQIILTWPSTIEIMKFLWELEDEHPGSVENTNDVLMLMRSQRCWQVTEARLDNVRIDMDQADANDVFEMPTTVTCSSLYQINRDAVLAAKGMSPEVAESAKPTAKVAPEVLMTRAPAPVLQVQALCNAVRARVLSQRSEHAGKITKMLLELDTAEVMALLENDDALYVRIESLYNLHNHYAK